MKSIAARPLTQDAFALYGDVIEIGPDRTSHFINGGTTERFHDLSTAVAFGEDARVIISMARARPFEPPITLDMMERHPEGSQAFVPVATARFVVTVAPDENGRPGEPEAFLAAPGQGINYFRGTWHGVLTALDNVTDFLIVDRDGDGINLEEYHFEAPVRVEL